MGRRGERTSQPSGVCHARVSLPCCRPRDAGGLPGPPDSPMPPIALRRQSVYDLGGPPTLALVQIGWFTGAVLIQPLPAD